ncbi:hypothetical protein FRC08_002197 [Ceratobasidium sp. 394]|nr:hypothetical protein FRC08_002197 [Ceratobasidium sp. 394]
MTFADFKQAVADYTDFVEGYIKKHLLFGMTDEEVGFNINENTPIQDRHTNTSAGYSYLTDEHNPFLAMRDTLAAQFAWHPRAAKLLERRLNEKGENIWKPCGVDSWLDHYEQATRHLITLTHLLSGQPARGTEIAMVKLLNDTHRVREMYYMGKGRMAIVLFYNKTRGVTGKDRMVAHCVPWRITRLFFQMHGLIRPFALQLIHRTLRPTAFRIQEMYAFALRGRHMKGQDVSNELRWFFRQYLDVNIGLRHYRHFAIAVMRKFMLEYIGPMERALAIVDAQAGHSSVVAGRHYAVQAANAYQIDAETLSRFFLCSVSWYKVVMGDDSLSEATHDAFVEADAQVQGKARQALALPSHNPGSCFDDVAALIRSENQKLAEQLRTGILADSMALACTNQVSAAPAPVRVEEWHRQLLVIIQDDHKANWTCQGQGEAIAHILKRDSSVLVVLPTGFGKSFLFLGAAIATQGISVVVTLFKALLDGHLRTAKLKGIKAIKYEMNPTLTDTTRLVFVPAENAVWPSFKAWCQRMQADDLLLRIFFDEAHEALTGQLYRDVMKQMQALVELDVPVVAMTAGLPPSLEPDLHREIGGPNWVIVREKTQRKNLHFRTAQF